MFQDEQFTSALLELDTPDLDGYELFVEVSEIKVYRKYDEASGLYEYKIFGHMACDGKTMQDMYVDFDYSRKWNSQYLKEAYEDSLDGEPFIYWQSNWPFPLANRDYIYVRDVRNMDDTTWVAMQRSHTLEGVPARSGVIRVDDFKQSLVVRSVAPDKMKVFMYYFENPGGYLPAWIINWAAKKGVPGFMKDMVKAVAGYEEFLAQKNK